MLGVLSHSAPALALNIAWVGVILYGLTVVFHLVTLPVELDASGRALKVLKTQNYLTADEMPGAKQVLTAAAFTYIATAMQHSIIRRVEALTHLFHPNGVVMGLICASMILGMPCWLPIRPTL